MLPVSTIACDFLFGYRELTQTLGADPDTLLQRTGIDPHLSREKSARIPTAKLGELLELSAAVLKCPDFGMRLAEIQGANPFEPLDKLIRNAPTVRDVLACSSEHSEAYCTGITLTLDHDGPLGQAFFRTDLPEDVTERTQLVEQMALLSQYGIVRLSGGRARFREIWFQHAPRAKASTYSFHFKAPVRFQQELQGRFLSETDLQASVVDRNEAAFRTYRQVFATSFPARDVPLPVRVKYAVERAFWDGECTRKRVAELMKTHERTLLRRLSASGTSFQQIREHVRRTLALRYLAQTNLSLTEVTGRLGYSELPVFTRSCQRWFKAAPADLRRRLTYEMENYRCMAERCPEL